MYTYCRYETRNCIYTNTATQHIAKIHTRQIRYMPYPKNLVTLNKSPFKILKTETTCIQEYFMVMQVLISLFDPEIFDTRPP